MAVASPAISIHPISTLSSGVDFGATIENVHIESLSGEYTCERLYGAWQEIREHSVDR